MRWPVRLGALLLLVVTVLGYGYWRAWSRAHITLLVLLVAADPVGVPVPLAEPTLRDSAGTTRAKARRDARFGSVSFIHPQHSSCEAEDQSATTSTDDRVKWDRCIGEKFSWQASWVRRVSTFDIQFAQCRVTEQPLSL